ncbi:hypothetical protein Mapa_014811 [Marchantia paleacea]|nr:hypothetical protein Mapa_014811 [Marchantia paleacea]
MSSLPPSLPPFLSSFTSSYSDLRKLRFPTFPAVGGQSETVCCFFFFSSLLLLCGVTIDGTNNESLGQVVQVNECLGSPLAV